MTGAAGRTHIEDLCVHTGLPVQIALSTKQNKTEQTNNRSFKLLGGQKNKQTGGHQTGGHGIRGRNRSPAWVVKQPCQLMEEGGKRNRKGFVKGRDPYKNFTALLVTNLDESKH